MIERWTIAGAGGEPIYGATHLPAGGAAAAAGDLLICHGFKGYKDYGFFPHLAEAAAARGLAAHRFNFSHSGVTEHDETFERPDLFERDTWGKQVHDVHAVAAAVRAGALPGTGGAGRAPRPMVWFGHSRGGVTVLLAAWRVFAGRVDLAPPPPEPAGLVSAAAPHVCCSLSDDQVGHLRRAGYLESPSSRTGQVLRIGRDWLEEMERSPGDFDPMTAIEKVRCPVLIVHGDKDATVPVDAAHALASAGGAGVRLEVIEGASHVFGCPNPLALDRQPPEATRRMIGLTCDFAVRVVGEGRGGS